MQKFYFVSLILLILRCLDLICTYIYMPNLEEEYNPLVSVFGATWPTFLLFQLLLFLFIEVWLYIYCTQKRISVTEKGLHFTDFIYVYFFGKLRPWPQRMFSVPTHLRPHLIFNGFLFTSVAIMVSLFAITNNLLLIFEATPYVHFLLKHYTYFFPMVFICIALSSAHLFFYQQYKVYKRSITDSVKG